MYNLKEIKGIVHNKEQIKKKLLFIGSILIYLIILLIKAKIIKNLKIKVHTHC